MNLVDELHAIASALERAKIPYAVCGGIAVTAYGATRSTKDIDIVIRPEDVEATLAAVAPLGYTLPAQPMTFGVGTPRERNVQRVNKIEGSQHLILDPLIADAAYAGTLDDRVEVALPEGSISFVSLETLLRMKRTAGRPIDLQDIKRLEDPDAT